MSSAEPVRLLKGANLSLDQIGAELGSVTVFLDSRGRDGTGVDADISVLLLDASGRVRSSDDLVFYNQPVALGGAVHLRDRLADEEGGWSTDVVTLELDDITDEIERVVVAASLDIATGLTFGDLDAVRLRMQRTADAVDLLVYDIVGVGREAALVFGEIYRRSGVWKIRAVGQGFSGGLEELVSAHGVDVASESVSDDPPGESSQTRPDAREAQSDETQHGDVARTQASEDPAAVDQEPHQPMQAKAVSVRRPTRAPRLPEDWNRSIPAEDGNDWQPARLFPVAGIGSGEEQERRATSALLAVMSHVREFGLALTTQCGSPRGIVTSFIEVPFGQDEEAYRPDGVIRVTWGKRSWTALVEVKTSTGRLDAQQIDHYVEIARTRAFDAVITISNELVGGDSDHPVLIDRRKLRKVSLHHLSWDEIRAKALLVARHKGVSDPSQAKVLEEFIRYMEHGRSGMGGMGDMGQNWVKVREAVKAKTARSTDKPVGDVSARFDELVQHLAHHLTGLLGVEVQALTPRQAPDHAGRRQQLADSGLLFGRLKVPGAVDVIVVSADLRSDKVTASLVVPAPRGETRPSTRVNWLVRQLPEGASDAIRIEAQLAGSKGASTAALLGQVRRDPTCLVPNDPREIRAFTVSLDLPMGAKRASGSGTLIGSVKSVTTAFYADVVQHLRPWVGRSL